VHQRSLQLHFPAIDDTLPELTEGFIYYLVVVNSQLDPRDVGRIDFFNRFTLVQIQDNDCEPQFLGLYPYLFFLPIVLCMWNVNGTLCTLSVGTDLLGEFMDYYISLLEYFLYAPKKVTCFLSMHSYWLPYEWLVLSQFWLCEHTILNWKNQTFFPLETPTWKKNISTVQGQTEANKAWYTSIYTRGMHWGVESYHPSSTNYQLFANTHRSSDSACSFYCFKGTVSTVLTEQRLCYSLVSLYIFQMYYIPQKKAAA